MATLKRLEEHRQKLISLNRVHGYSTTLAPTDRRQKYFELLTSIREQKHILYAKLRENRPKYVESLEVAKNNIIGALSNPITTLKQHEQYVQ